MSTFDERLEMTNMIEENMADIFDDDNTIVQEFGCMSLVGQNEDLFNYLKGAWVPPLCFRSFEQLFPEWGEKWGNLVYLRMVVAGLLHQVDAGALGYGVGRRSGTDVIGACDWWG